MQKNLDKIAFLTSSIFIEEDFLKLGPQLCFESKTISYLDSLSKKIAKLHNLKEYPDVATFGFFCRKANLISIRNNSHLVDNEIKVGRGLVFHISPSNVPVNFAYSFVSGLLTGNLNIVRVPSKPFKQIEMICNAIDELNQEPEWEYMRNRNHFVSYDKHSNATDYFSKLCDVRVIWGGDDSIKSIRQSNIQSKAFDITFADRYSISLINSIEYLHFENKAAITQGFYNDTFLFDQNACTAPHLIVWIGDNDVSHNAQNIFWNLLHNKVLNEYNIASITGVDKLTNFLSYASINGNNVKLSKIDNYIWRVNISELTKDLDNYKGNSGYFMEYLTNDISDILQIVNSKYQTLSYFGFSKLELNDFVKKFIPKGIDRIVPIGKTTDFSLNWDGYKLVEQLTRTLVIK